MFSDYLGIYNCKNNQIFGGVFAQKDQVILNAFFVTFLRFF